jgi:hypothetical protein
MKVAVVVTPAQAGVHLPEEVWIPALQQAQGKLFAGMTGVGLF